MATRSHSTTFASPLPLLALIGLAAAAAAVADEPKDVQQPGARITVNKQTVKCELGRGPCVAGSNTEVVVEQDLTVKLEIKQKPTAACEATIDFDYQQRDTFAHVAGAIENAQCAASGGDYVLAVTIRDGKGEVTTLEFPQQWARSDADAVKFTHDLPIGPNVDLQSIRSRRLRCTCTEPAAQP